MQLIHATCQPRADILTGSFNPEIFTASLSQVMDCYRGRATPTHTLYTDAEQFFREVTYPTEGLRMALAEVFGRLAGDNSVPAIHRLETAFGGGKTHTLIALTHLGYRGRDLTAVTDGIIDTALLPVPGSVTVVGVAGDELPVHQSQGTALVPYTLWGEIAFQVGGEAMYRQLTTDATSYAAPGSNYFAQVFGAGRVLILLDELAQYAARLEAARPDGADQLAAFLMALHNYARTHAGIAVVLTLASQTDAFARQTQRLTDLIAEVRGGEVSPEEAQGMAQRAATGMRSVVARDAVTVVPVVAAEISQVLAKRLFASIDQQAAQDTVDAYLDMYQKSAAALPDRALRQDFRDALLRQYPFHPTFIAFLNQKLATVETFHGTRGVLRVLALAIRSLWSTSNSIPMLHTCHLDLRDARTINEIIGRTGSGDLLPVLNTDIGGPDTAGLESGRSRAELADRKNPHPEGWPLHEYAWKTVFLHSLVGRADGLGSNLFGITEREALFEVAFPGLTPPQVETALHAIEGSEGAFYLRFNQGRYYASLDPSETRALASIRGALRREAVQTHLASVARRVVRADAGTFQVQPDVSAPEHIPDATRLPVLALIALDANEIDAEACMTTAGPNRPRQMQNQVVLLVPETVHVQGEVWSEDRVRRMHEVQHRLEETTADVLARRQLQARPENHGITAAHLAERNLDGKDFAMRLRERELALETLVAQTYHAVWFPAATGQPVAQEIKTAGGEGGASTVEAIREVLQTAGKLIVAERATTQETILSLAGLFFDVSQTPTLEEIRGNVACNRRWPLLDQPALLERIIRTGVSGGVWCLFRMGSAEHVKPQEFFSRETGDIPLELNLDEPGWSLVPVPGARQRGWIGAVQVDPAQVEHWVTSAIAEDGVVYMTNLAQKITQKHGEVPEQAIFGAVESLRQSDRLMTYHGAPEQQHKPTDLIHGAGALLRAVQASDVVMTPAEAARRGWVQVETPQFRRTGAEATRQFLALLPRLGSLYARGARSTIKSLDVWDLEVQGGGRLRLTLEGVPPAAMQHLSELFEVLATVVKQGSATDMELDIAEPDEQCLLIQAFQQGGSQS